MLLISHS
jgi:hypothetical protein